MTGPSAPPLVSVVIPCYNHASFLADAIRSAQAQTHQNIEIVVVDDGSTDDSATVAGGFSDVHLIRQSNAGLSAARNAGLRASHGEFLVFLDADDRLLPQAVEAGIAAFARSPDAALVFGAFRWIDTQGRVTAVPGPYVLHGDAYEAMVRWSFISMHATVLFRRAALEACGGYDESFPACEDYDLYLRLMRREIVRQHDVMVAEYRRHTTNKSGDPRLMIDSALRALGRQWPFVRNDARLRDAFDAGVQFWVTAYANDTTWPAATGRWRGGWRQTLEGTVLLLRHVPRWFVRRTVERWRRSAGMFVWRRLALARASRSTRPGVDRYFTSARSTQPRPLPLPIGRLDLGDLRHVTPIDRHFGFSRGWPVDRHYVDRFIAENALSIQGRVLEVKDSAYTLRFGADRVTCVDVLDVDAGNPLATIVADLTDGAGVPDDTFDCVVLTQTLHLIYDVRDAIGTLYRILKPGGVLLLTVPGISKVDSSCPWYWSFTAASIRRLFEESFPASEVHVEAHGNVLAATAFLQGLAVSELTPEELDADDVEFPVTVCVRAVKPPAAA